MAQHQGDNSGISYFFAGLTLIFKKGIKRYTIVPLIINTIIFIALWWFSLHEVSLLISWVDTHLPSWLTWFSWLIYIIAILALLLFSAYLFTAIALIIASPFYSFLAEKIQKKLTGREVGSKLTFAKLMLIAPRSIAREFKKLLSFLPWVLIIFLCYFIPVINLFTSVLWFVLLCWFNVVQYADYAFDNNEISFPQMKKQLSQQKSLSLGFGFITTVFLMIPFFNILVIPAAIAGTTKMYVDHWHPARLSHVE
ncbi:sulfate transporter CysZ [Cysteiniphilum halobium]|uniref:sulfate transporter CysZ n=1 Tax=Cysteiniphilum halobium TaxID=2219059 RepID=UPI000E65E858|nr:sulfate transporter CysZ [Cysteiniphilum halobium]